MELDPPFRPFLFHELPGGRRAADVVGRHLEPPENAVVLCMDEKPHIHALGRAQGWLRLPNGRALTGQTHEYRRHGTTTLFAALETSTSTSPRLTPVG